MDDPKLIPCPECGGTGKEQSANPVAAPRNRLPDLRRRWASERLHSQSAKLSVAPS
jgi:hypothetical protein